MFLREMNLELCPRMRTHLTVAQFTNKPERRRLPGFLQLSQASLECLRAPAFIGGIVDVCVPRGIATCGSCEGRHLPGPAEGILRATFLDRQQLLSQARSDIIDARRLVVLSLRIGKDGNRTDDRRGATREQLGAFATADLCQQFIQRDLPLMDRVAEATGKHQQGIPGDPGEDCPIERRGMQFAADHRKDIHAGQFLHPAMLVRIEPQGHGIATRRRGRRRAQRSAIIRGRFRGANATDCGTHIAALNRNAHGVGRVDAHRARDHHEAKAGRISQLVA